MSPQQHPRPGTFIVIEGTDGSGKSTQFKRLVKRLEQEGHAVEAIEFPQHTEASAYFVEKFLQGGYGELGKISPYVIALFYTLDRYDAKARIERALADGKVVLAGRYTGSGMAHQGSNLALAEQRRGFFVWLDNLEFEVLKIPRPDKSFVLRVPFEVSEKLLASTGKKRDIHESDHGHLKKTVEVFDDLVNLFPRDFTAVDCVRGGKLMTTDQVEDMLWKSVQPLLPAPSAKKATAKAADAASGATQKQDNPFIFKGNAGWEITEAGHQFLKEAVTDPTGDVYGFGDKLSATTVAAAMARLSRRGDDMRVTLLDEFAVHAGKDEGLLKRVITAYGDDSVQQLVGQHIVVENASNLLTKKLERGRLAAYLEQSTRYIYFDKKDQSGKYKYFTPEYLEPELKALYNQTLDTIFDLYSSMVHRLTDHIQSKSDVPDEERDGAWRSATRAQACDAIRPVLPVATKSTVGIYASGQALESLIMHLLSDELPEAHEVGRKLLVEARKVTPAFLERVDINKRGVASQGYRAETYQAVKNQASHLPVHYGQADVPVILTDHWPKNELDLVPDMLYEHSHLSLREIRQTINTWPYDQKKKVFDTYMGDRYNRRHKPGRALEKAHYSWDLLCDYGSFRDLQRHRMVDDMEWQALTPRYGYEIPELVEEADLGDLFERCFDLSYQLYSRLQKANHLLEAQYVTLLGHRMRWKVTMNAREAFHFNELRTSPQGHPGYRKLVLQMHEKLAEVHPVLAEHMKFVNTDEDPELTRLAAERYTQAKLEQLGKR